MKKRYKQIWLPHLAKLIKNSPETRYQIHKKTGINEATLLKIVKPNFNGHIYLCTAEILFKYFNYDLMKIESEVKNETQSNETKK